MSRDGKTLVRQLYQTVFVEGHVDQIEQFFAPDIVDRTPMPGQPDARKALAQFIPMFHGAFSPRTLTLDVVAAEAGYVGVHYHWSAKHTGPFLGVPASGRDITFHGSAFFRVDRDRLVEHWGVADIAGLMQQIAPARQG